jgi:hypothetical protein
MLDIEFMPVKTIALLHFPATTQRSDQEIISAVDPPTVRGQRFDGHSDRSDSIILKSPEIDGSLEIGDTIVSHAEGRRRRSVSNYIDRSVESIRSLHLLPALLRSGRDLFVVSTGERPET